MPSAIHLVPHNMRPAVRQQARGTCTGCSSSALVHTGAATVSGPSIFIVLGVLALGGTAGAMILAKHKIIGALAGAIAGIAGLGLYEKLFAATPKQAPVQPIIVAPPSTCADGSLAPGGNTAACPPPKMGPNDPDSPPGGWTYNAPVAAPTAIQTAAAALAAVDPCQKANEQLVRNFQAAAGLAQLNAAGNWQAASPPGTDGRYGGDTAKALKQYVPTAPDACYSNSNPVRPAWWGAVGAFTNP